MNKSERHIFQQEGVNPQLDTINTNGLQSTDSSMTSSEGRPNTSMLERSIWPDSESIVNQEPEPSPKIVLTYSEASIEHFETKEKTMRYIEREATTRRVFIPEGPPIYLWPFRETQQWDSASFINGWNLVNDLSSRVPMQKTQHFVLFDDYNNKPEGASETDLQDQLEKMRTTSDVLAQSPIFLSDDLEHAPIYKFLESSFAKQDSLNHCSALDANFQTQKIIPQLEAGNLSIEKMDQALLVMFHHEDFKHQQQMMLKALVQEDLFKQMPRTELRALISNMYRHVWLNSDGQITEVTRPVWHRHKFEHRNIPL